MAPSTPQGLLVGSKREHPVLPPWHPHSTVLTNWHFIPWPIWSPAQAILVPHHYCGEPPRTHSLCPSSPLDTHKVTVVPTTKHKSSTHTKSSIPTPTAQHSFPMSSFMVAIFRQWSCSQLCQACQSACSCVLALFWDFSLSHVCPWITIIKIIKL